MTDSAMDAKVLRRAAELVDQGHCKHSTAIDAAGLSVGVSSPEAVAWCAFGALLRAGAEIGRDHNTALRAVRSAVGVELIATWNNAPSRTADEVAAALRTAADRCDGVSSEPSSATPHECYKPSAGR